MSMSGHGGLNANHSVEHLAPSTKLSEVVTQESSTDPTTSTTQAMSRDSPAPVYNPLEQFKLQNEKPVITQLNVAQVFKSDHSFDDIAKSIASQYSDSCSAIGGHDVNSISRYLKDNPNCKNNDYAHWAELLTKNDTHGDRISEVQAILQDLDIAIDRAKRK
ncbi:MAG: hypothetical protein Q9161_003404 [Pseudevernia consocians]